MIVSVQYYVDIDWILSFLLLATSVTIGLQKTSYSVYETDEYQVVCAEVLSGDIAGRSIDIEYVTTSDAAEGKTSRGTMIFMCTQIFPCRHMCP